MVIVMYTPALMKINGRDGRAAPNFAHPGYSCLAAVVVDLTAAALG